MAMAVTGILSCNQPHAIVIAQLRAGVVNSSIASTACETPYTSHTERVGSLFIPKHKNTQTRSSH